MPNIAITNYCNLRCPYCFAEDFTQQEKEEISEEQLINILEFLSRDKISRIGVIGGEPTLHSNFNRILDILELFSKNNSNIPIVIFTNGIELKRYIERLNNNITCLINLNEPEIIGEDKFIKIKRTLDKLKLSNKLDYVSIGINLYPEIKNMNYIFEIAREYFKDHIRCSFVAPTCKYTTTDKDKYYNEAKPIFLKCVELAEKYQITLELDCNHIPECYFTEEELTLVKKYTYREHKKCSPVVDITPQLTATSCFGTYDPVNILDFDNLAELTKFLQENKMDKLKEKNNTGKCKDCEEFLNDKCQGGCLAFAKNQQNI